jgi:hypothetical protein
LNRHFLAQAAQYLSRLGYAVCRGSDTKCQSLPKLSVICKGATPYNIQRCAVYKAYTICPDSSSNVLCKPYIWLLFIRTRRLIRYTILYSNTRLDPQNHIGCPRSKANAAEHQTVCSVRMWSSKCANVWGMKPCNRPVSIQHAPRVRTKDDDCLDFR